MVKSIPEEVGPAALAQKLGQECKVPLGSMWYGGLARSIEQHLSDGHSLAEVEEHLRMTLGLSS